MRGRRSRNTRRPPFRDHSARRRAAAAAPGAARRATPCRACCGGRPAGQPLHASPLPGCRRRMRCWRAPRGRARRCAFCARRSRGERRGPKRSVQRVSGSWGWGEGWGGREAAGRVQDGGKKEARSATRLSPRPRCLPPPTPTPRPPRHPTGSMPGALRRSARRRRSRRWWCTPRAPTASWRRSSRSCAPPTTSEAGEGGRRRRATAAEGGGGEGRRR
jgi:hypothetical protein